MGRVSRRDLFSRVPIQPDCAAARHDAADLGNAEGHAIIEAQRGAAAAAAPVVYVFHTIRWTTGGPSSFAPDGRNGEDLGVEIFVADRAFAPIDVPMITSNWNLDLAPGATSPCLYDKANYRFCANLKTVMKSSDPAAKDIEPKISFRVEADIGGGGTRS